TTAIKRGKALPEHVHGAVSTMLQLNRRAAEIALGFRVHTMTDVTGYGLLGHASEVAKASHLSIQIDHTRIPVLAGALQYSRAGFCAAGLTNNEQFFGARVSIANSIVVEWRNLLFDPQTSGGLLLFCHADDADALRQRLRAETIDAVEIG